MNRPWQIWLAFGACVGVLLAALAWISAEAVRLDRAEADARQRAAFEEDVRLALWRMDSALTPLVAQESGRPYFVYSAFYPTDRAYTRMFAEVQRGEILVPSPLLAQPPALVKLHFQIGPGGEFTSPQAPTGNMQDLAESRFTTHEQIVAASARLQKLKASMALPDLLPNLPVGENVPIVTVRAGGQMLPDVASNLNSNANSNMGDYGANDRNSQRGRAGAEWVARNSYVQAEAANQQAFANDYLAPAANVNTGVFRAMWVNGELLLARRVAIDEQAYVQGCWLEWGEIRAALLDRIRDLLPNADLVAEIEAVADDNRERMLSALPARLIPGDAPALALAENSPMRLTLSAAWLGVLLAAVAVAILLRGIMALSERRAAFVSAVTHEMRTPLTTFRMYTELLADGMVRDETKRQRYMGTLRREADRLAHLVENVLAFARLEHNGNGSAIETVGVAEFLGRNGDRLREVAGRAGFELTIETDDSASAAKMRVNQSAIERIVLNLVDNAGKYAASATDKRIHLSARQTGGQLVFRVRDHGPGIERGRLRHLFRAFNKSAHEAADTAPGVGLGLALSRRLARNMGGDLTYESADGGGAAFELRVPILAD